MRELQKVPQNFKKTEIDASQIKFKNPLREKQRIANNATKPEKIEHIKKYDYLLNYLA